MTGVLSSVRRAWGRLPKISADSVQEFEEETNLNRRAIKQHSQVFLQPHSAPDERERSLAIIGHNAYAGGIDALELIVSLVPHMLTVMVDPSQSASFRMQVLRTLSEVCHHNRFIIDTVWKTPRVRKGLVHVVGNRAEPVHCQWACYLLHIMVADSAPIINDLEQTPGLRGMLEYIADNPHHNWTAFGCDVADHLLRLLGFRPPEIKAETSAAGGTTASNDDYQNASPGGVTVNVNLY